MEKDGFHYREDIVEKGPKVNPLVAVGTGGLVLAGVLIYHKQYAPGITVLGISIGIILRGCEIKFGRNS